VDLTSKSIWCAPTVPWFGGSRYLEALLRSRGAVATPVPPAPTHDTWQGQAYFICEPGDPDRAAATAAGVTVLDSEQAVRGVLGPPCADFPARLRSALSSAREGMVIENLHIAPPASPELIRDAEAVMGFPMPEAMRAFYSQVNGFSFYLWSSTDDQLVTDRSLPLVVPDETNLQWLDVTDPFGNLQKHAGSHRNGGYYYIGVACVLGLDEMFLDPRKSSSVERYGPYTSGFLLDAFSSYEDAMLEVLDDRRDVVVRLTTDHGASTEDFMPIPFETYLEMLIVDFGTNRWVRRTSADPLVGVETRIES
jgi:hypothetical protein